MLIQLRAVLEPVHFRSWDPSGLAEERDLPAEHVIKLKVARFDDLGSVLVIVVVHRRLRALLNRRVYPASVPALVATL